jgi:hypothetical protein
MRVIKCDSCDCEVEDGKNIKVIDDKFDICEDCYKNENFGLCLDCKEYKICKKTDCPCHTNLCEICYETETMYCLICKEYICNNCVFFGLMEDFQGGIDYERDCICKWCVIKKNKTKNVFKDEMK